MAREQAEDIAIFTGRFQPVHLGHLNTLSELLRRHKQVIIAIGTRRFRNFQHPFTGYERKKMWEAAILDSGIPISRVKVLLLKKTRVATNLRAYTSFIVNRLGKEDVVYYSGNPRMKAEYERNGVVVKDLPIAVTHAATDIRERIVSGQDWRDLVSPSVARIISEQKLDQRLKLLKSKEKRSGA